MIRTFIDLPLADSDAERPVRLFGRLCQEPGRGEEGR